MIQIFSLVELGAQQELQVRGMMGLAKLADMHQTSELRPGKTQRGNSPWLVIIVREDFMEEVTPYLSFQG